MERCISEQEMLQERSIETAYGLRGSEWMSYPYHPADLVCSLEVSPYTHGNATDWVTRGDPTHNIQVSVQRFLREHAR